MADGVIVLDGFECGLVDRGVARIFQRGCQSDATHQIVTVAKILSWHFRHLL